MIPHPKSPLHGVTLAQILEQLVEDLGWERMAQRVPINCFKNKPSIASSLYFLRRTPWARKKVEQLFLERAEERESGRSTRSRRDGRGGQPA